MIFRYYPNYVCTVNAETVYVWNFAFALHVIKYYYINPQGSMMHNRYKTVERKPEYWMFNTST